MRVSLSLALASGALLVAFAQEPPVQQPPPHAVTLHVSGFSCPS